MLTADELRDLGALIERGKAGGGHDGYFTCEKFRCERMACVLSDARWLYVEAAREGKRLDCLTTAVRALAGALRERMAT